MAARQPRAEGSASNAHGLRRFVASLLWGTPIIGTGPVVVQIVLVGLGVTGGLIFLADAGQVTLLLGLVATTTALHFGAGQRRDGAAWGVLRWLSRVGYFTMLGFLAYLALVFGYMLAWTLAAGAVVAIGVAGAGAVVTARRPFGGVRVPAILPVGLWIAGCLWGGAREGGTVRCSDHLEVNRQPGVIVALPSAGAQAECVPGRSLAPARYPRMLYPTNEPRRYLLAASPGRSRVSPEPTSAFTGGLCELRLGAADATVVGCRYNDFNHLAYISESDEVLAVGPSLLVRTAAEAPFVASAPERELDFFPSFVGYLPDLDPESVYVTDDHMGTILLFRADRLEQTDTVAAMFSPNEVRYDPERREGLYCFAAGLMQMKEAPAYLALAFADHPMHTRRLGSSADVPWAWLAFSDGCDLDLHARRAYVGVATLGRVWVLDYDTGQAITSFWAGFGIRTLLLDPTGTRLYTSNFLNGDVLEFDAATGGLLRRWFAGRFIRHLAFSADRSSLLAVSTLGIVRIALD